MVGYWIQFEGLDGAGTTTQMGPAVQYLFERDKGQLFLQLVNRL